MNIEMMLFGVLWIVTVVIFTALKKADQAFKEDERYQAALDKLHEWAAFTVRYAKDIGEENDMEGRDRREIAVQALSDMRDKLDLDIDDTQILMLVRAAYTIMKDEGQEPVYLIENNEDEEG